MTPPKTQPDPAAAATAQAFIHFSFYRIDPAFRKLLSNEKVVAKEEYLSSIDRYEGKMHILSYSMVGLRADCEILLWRISPKLELLQEMSARTRSSGLGKYLLPVYGYLAQGRKPFDPDAAEKPGAPGRRHYLFVHLVARTPEWNALTPDQRRKLAEDDRATFRKFPRVLVHEASCAGLDDFDSILAVETDAPQEAVKLATALHSTKSSRYGRHGTPTFSCIREDLSSVLEQLG